MKKFVPYVNLETVKDSDGKIERFIVRTVSYLPADSKIATSGEGKIADSVLYRPLTITYSGTSDKFDYFGADFTIERKDVGLLERGVNVKINSSSSDMLKDGDDEGGVIIEFEDPLP